MIWNIRHKFLFNYLDKKIPQNRYKLLKLGDQFVCCRDVDFDVNTFLSSVTGTCGISNTLELAKIKAISEFVEREAFRNSGANSSHGFAAFPFIFNRNKAYKSAKTTSFGEILERYVTQKWVENDNIKSEIYNSPYKDNMKFYSDIQKEIKFLEYYRIIPSILNAKNMISVVLYARTEYGWSFSCAASKIAKEAERNALKELYMNFIALYRITKKQISSSQEKVKQLFWVSQQDALIRARLNSVGEESIYVPEPLFRNIKTKYNDCYVVAQCYFAEYKPNCTSDRINTLYL